MAYRLPAGVGDLDGGPGGVNPDLEKFVATQKAYRRFPDATLEPFPARWDLAQIRQSHQRGRAGGQENKERRTPHNSEHHGAIPKGYVNETLRAREWFRF